MTSMARRSTPQLDDGRDVVDVDIRIIDNQDRNNHPVGHRRRWRHLLRSVCAGTAPATLRKAPYRLTFVDENGENNPQEVMGMAAHSEWALYGPYLDKSLIRNYMWYNISGEIMEWAPNVRYCELILDGEYRGLYLMMETITDGDDCRLNLSDDAYGSLGAAAICCGKTGRRRRMWTASGMSIPIWSDR